MHNGCILYVSNPDGYSGRSAAIGAYASSAFSIVDISKSFFEATYSHEIGHLFGCHHNIEEDINPYPAYASGYIYDQGSTCWHTIMSYPPTNIWGNYKTNCPHILYFTNPNVSYDGVLTGDSETKNNAKVIRDNYNKVRYFRPKDGVYIANQNAIDLAAQDFLYSPNEIRTNGSAVISSGADFEFFAGKEHTFKSGFEALKGSDFQTFYAPVCGSQFRISSNKSVTTKGNVSQPDSPLEIVQNLNIYPNPVKDNCKISFDLNEDLSNISVDLYSFTGQRVKNLFLGDIKMEGNSVDVNVTDLSNGVYFIIIKNGNIKSRTFKLVKS